MFPGGSSRGSNAWKLFRPCHTRTWFREYLSWRIDRLSWPFPAYHDSNRDGMSHRRAHKHRNRLFQWYRDAIAILALTVLCIGCRRELSPDAIYNEIEQKFISGELSQAKELSEKAYGRFE